MTNNVPQDLKKYLDPRLNVKEYLHYFIFFVIALGLLIYGYLISIGNAPEFLFLKQNESKYQFFIFVTVIYCRGSANRYQRYQKSKKFIYL
ncbi:hypothetical protein XA3_06730 [Xylocopilactobacillus apicola]|uniref:Uncharacterized protein n=1 Tax=Xylocopilactobacillus apicola TaxID=2932184 RepID=A0AAU9DBP2_9LACO|nr:hypothetical protein XA3_06730 [Xylocopilactobacillus apicola]